MSSQRNYANPFADEDTFNEGASRIFNLKADKGRETPQQVSLSLITVDEQIQVRVDKLSHDRVETLRAVFENGGEMKDPILVFNVDGEYLLIDGFHRYAAAHEAGLDTIKAVVREGTLDEAIDAAEEANMFHGLPLSNSDRKELLRRRLERGHRWATLTSSVIAKELGISAKTVGRWLDDLQSTGTFVPVGKKVGLDGKERDTQRIAAANRQRVQPDTPYTPADDPEFIRPDYHALGRTRPTNDTPALPFKSEDIEQFRRLMQQWDALLAQTAAFMPNDIAMMADIVREKYMREVEDRRGNAHNILTGLIFRMRPK